MTPHGIARDEWERKFSDHIKARSGVDDPDIFTSELESWPTSEDDWEVTLPHEAADENLLDWTDDEEK